MSGGLGLALMSVPIPLRDCPQDTTLPIPVTRLTVTQATISQGPLSSVIQLRDKMLSST